MIRQSRFWAERESSWWSGRQLFPGQSCQVKIIQLFCRISKSVIMFALAHLQEKPCSYCTSKVSCFSWRHTTILVAARPETWQFSSRRELHFSLLGEKLSILVATCCYEAPQYLLNSGRQTRHNCNFTLIELNQLKMHLKTHRGKESGKIRHFGD